MQSSQFGYLCTLSSILFGWNGVTWQCSDHLMSLPHFAMPVYLTHPAVRLYPNAYQYAIDTRNTTVQHSSMIFRARTWQALPRSAGKKYSKSARMAGFPATNALWRQGIGCLLASPTLIRSGTNGLREPILSERMAFKVHKKSSAHNFDVRNILFVDLFISALFQHKNFPVQSFARNVNSAQLWGSAQAQRAIYF